MLLERDELLNIRWELWEVSVLLAAFTVAQLAFYVCLPTMLRLSSAAALHLSLLSTDFYAIIAGVVFFQYKVHLNIYMYYQLSDKIFLFFLSVI
jgi:solute carrier family 35 protein F1/2